MHRSGGRCIREAAKAAARSADAENRQLDISRIEMRMAVLSARLSSPKKGDRPDILQEEYTRLAEELQRIRREWKQGHEDRKPL